MNQMTPAAANLGLTRCRAVALMVDGENLSPDYAGQVITATHRELGQIAVQRVYGDTMRLNGWLSAPGFRAMHAHAGKNVTDILLAVEAMELSFAGHVDGFAIATGDQDFAPLAWSLRARGFPVLGLLPACKAPEHLRKAFSQVSLLIQLQARPGQLASTLAQTPELPATKPQVSAPVAPTPPTTTLPDLGGGPVDPALLSAIRQILSNGPITTVDFGNALRQSGFGGAKGTQSWQAWFSRRPGIAAFTQTKAGTLISKA